MLFRRPGVGFRGCMLLQGSEFKVGAIGNRGIILTIYTV